MSHSKQTLIKSTLFLACMLGSSASTMAPNTTRQNHGQFISLHDIMDAIPDGYQSRGVQWNNGNIEIRFSPRENPTKIFTYKKNYRYFNIDRFKNDLTKSFGAPTQINTRDPLSDITNIQESEEQIAIEVLASLEELAQTAKKQKH